MSKDNIVTLVIYKCTQTPSTQTPKGHFEISEQDVEVVKCTTDYCIPQDSNDNIFGKRKFDRLSAEKILKRYDGYYLVTETHNLNRFKEKIADYIHSSNVNLQKVIDTNIAFLEGMYEAFDKQFGV